MPSTWECGTYFNEVISSRLHEKPNITTVSVFLYALWISIILSTLGYTRLWHLVEHWLRLEKHEGCLRLRNCLLSALNLGMVKIILMDQTDFQLLFLLTKFFKKNTLMCPYSGVSQPRILWEVARGSPRDHNWKN